MTQTARATLVGVATGSPDGGVSIVRLSGPRALEIAEELSGPLPTARRLVRRAIALDGDEADDGLVVEMPGPASFTGEDVVELHVHAGARNVRKVVDACMRRGATAAGAGDFTRRAFELGRLSLDQAEGIAAVIGAQTGEALRQARRLVAGDLGRDAGALAERVAALRAEVEANLDFPDDVAADDTTRWRAEIAEFEQTLAGWLSQFEGSRRARERTRVVLAGPPNAGKSSLFNALLRRPRSIVADRPGTTRDYVEAEASLDGFECTLVDTAGLRAGEDTVEEVGVARSHDQIAGADVVVWVEAADADAAPRKSGDGAVIEVEAKRDLGVRRPDWVGVQLVDREAGVDELIARLKRWKSGAGSAGWVGLARHRDAAVEANRALAEARARLQREDALELAAFDLGVAQGRLGEITGRSSLGPIGADVLDRIFSTFCIGK